ncbi:rCG56906, partial [Rattus norvegicus]
MFISRSCEIRVKVFVGTSLW